MRNSGQRVDHGGANRRGEYTLEGLAGHNVGSTKSNDLADSIISWQQKAAVVAGGATPFIGV
ncbi:MAG: hypothetical protein EBU46_12700 [Nitrosomonadaceae bacterium]|nr:hypothetical protein [Nitrosomonadaceae bacterium]